MTNTLKILASALVAAGLASCAAYSGERQASAGNPKFTTGFSATSVTGVDASARERAGETPR
jgi:hypothetical protein